MKKIFFGILIFLFVITFVAFVRLTPKSIPNNFAQSEIIQNSVSGEVVQNQNQNSGSGISINELLKHNSESDCWVAYDGKVYDITNFLPNHPGGINKILPYCGTSGEFQNAFTKQHGTSKVKLLMSVGVLMGDFDIVGSVN